jgi:aspartate aminotransferase-like enzyme
MMSALGCDKQVRCASMFPGTRPSSRRQVELPALDRRAGRKGRWMPITVVHNETSTGVDQPGASDRRRQCAGSARRRWCWSMRSLPSAVRPFETDAWGLDLVLLTSSQKALALPPGLAFCAAVSDRALARAATVKGRGWYFDFLNLEKSLLKRARRPPRPPSR